MKTFLSAKAKVSSKGWVVIPKEIRDVLEIQPGDEVRFTFWPSHWPDALAGRLSVRKVPEDPIAATAGIIKRRPGEPFWTQQMAEEHREEVEKEEQEFREAHPAQDRPAPKRRRSA